VECSWGYKPPKLNRHNYYGDFIELAECPATLHAKSAHFMPRARLIFPDRM
jgi:hypothetical protein